MSHRRLFVMIKIVLLAGIMTSAFSIGSHGGKVGYHGAASTYAESQCGNGVCESSAAKCSMSTIDCSKIDTSTCSSVNGCMLKDNPTTYACEGNFDPCISLDVANCTANTACTLGADSKCTSTDTTKLKSCKEFGETACKSYPTCSRKGTTNQSCQGGIQPPKNDVDCNILATQLKNFGFSIVRYPAYTENGVSCPADCQTPACQGNGVEFWGKTTCEDLSIDYPETACVMYHSADYQCAYDSKNNKCIAGASCTSTSAAVCGNGAVEGNEACDNGVNNGKPGQCNKTCNGSFYDTLLVVLAGTIGGNGWDPSNTSTQMQSVGNGVYKFSITLNKGTYEYKAALHGNRNENYGAQCKPGGTNKSITIPSDNYLVDFYFDYTTKLLWDSLSPDQCPVCGNGSVERSEVCDNGPNNSDTIPSACTTKCDGIVANPNQDNNFEDNFDDGNYDGRTLGYQGGSVIDGKLVMNAGWGDTYRSDYPLTQHFSIGAKLTDVPGNNVWDSAEITIYNPSYTQKIGTPSVHNIYLKYEDENGNLSIGTIYWNGNTESYPTLTSVNVGAGIDPRTLKLEVDGNNYKGYVNGTVYIVHSDAFGYRNLMAKQYPSLRSDNVNATFDDFKLELFENGENVPDVCGDGKTTGLETCDNGDSNGKAGMCNTMCNGYVAADNTCGNGKCESNSACSMNTNECAKIGGNLALCSTIAGCYTDSQTTTSCEGEFSCTTFTNKDVCGKFGCSWSSDNKCVDIYKDNKKISGFCPSFSSDLCKTLSNELNLCSQKTTTNSRCNGVIMAPKSVADCVTLNTIGSTFGITAAWKDTYTETYISCPVDCANVIKCGNKIIEGTETCDDGNTTDGDGCSSKCLLQDKYVPYVAQSAVTIVLGDGVTYDATKKTFFVPAETTAFMFQDNGKTLGYGNKIVFVVLYSPTGTVETSATSEVKWASEFNLFTMPYVGTLNYPTTSFTFTDNGKTIKAVYSANQGWTFTPTEKIIKCGDGIKEGIETCDDGVNNGKLGMCNTTCNGIVPKEISCGNNIVEPQLGETCDNGMNNGKPGMCNKTCNGRTVYNNYCGDKICQTNGACSLTNTIACSDLNKTAVGKALCPTVGCSLQYVNNSTCNGRVSCEKIIPEKFWGTIYGAQKYCMIAGCSRDEKNNLCNNPKDNKAPSCSNIGKSLGLTNTTEYCPRLPGCTSDNKPVETICVGGNVLRTDKLDQNGCSTIKGTWTTEDKNSCPSDCDTTCGNKICDSSETASSCATDCLSDEDWPMVLYSSTAPKDGSLVKGPVKVSVYLPGSCKIINNGGNGSYNFKYNGYYVFQVSCPWSDKPFDMVANVSWLQGDTIVATNVKDMSSTGGSTVYRETKNSLIDQIPANPTVIDVAKKSMAEETLLAAGDGKISPSVGTREIKTTNSISYENDNKVYQKTTFEKSIDGSASTKSVAISIPADAVLKTKDGNKTTDFNGVFLAPTPVTGAILATATKAIDGDVDLIIKAGDVGDAELSAKNAAGTTLPFTMTIQTEKTGGSTLAIYLSQDGKVWNFYTGAFVEPCASGVNNHGYNCATFEIPHLTYYGIATDLNEDTGGTQEQPSGGNNGGSAGGSTRHGSNESGIVASGSETAADESGTVIDTGEKKSGAVCTMYTPELNEAYAFAFANTITTINNCEKADLQGSLIRSHMAKMMSNFAINTLGMKPNTGTVCNFTDMSTESNEMKFYANLSCQLGLMGLNDQGTANQIFNPNETVTRAQFGTVLSRLLWQTQNNGGEPYYIRHLQTLKNAGIMTNIDTPYQPELRGYTMLMMQRVTNYHPSPSEKATPGQKNEGQTLRHVLQDLFY